ncbi:MAG: HAD family hydrolase [Nevskiaceae bacterium]|nr:MAG: HAD family hydrolase [Nevskiaceae bacterium]TBR73105.1 MAG: HAD family hydrolase [Nevskiaceae bacterium]
MTTPSIAPAGAATLALFDLDHTLLAGDSDYLWGEFLADSGLVDRTRHAAANERFYADYVAGTLDIQAYGRFVLEPLTPLDPARLDALRREFIATRIRPIVAPGAPALLTKHRDAGHTLVITTSTNRFITEPIVALLGVGTLIATEPEIVDGRLTGRLAGIPNFQAGKITRLEHWLAVQPQRFSTICAYSDSHNDLPLLERADLPTAVDPDDRLRAIATQRHWPIISLRD